MNTPSWWQRKGAIAQLLRPVSLLWQLGTYLRHRFAKAKKLEVPVWCVGNVTAGGGGKTPFCLYVGGQAKASGINAYFIARGYGGALAGPLLVDATKHTSEEVGDEALLLANILPTVVAHQRIEAAEFAAAQGAALLIMDDGLQYPHLHKDKIFLLLKGSQPLGNGYVMPAGPLRESLKSALQKSDVVVQIDANHAPINTDKPVWQAATNLSLPKLENNQLIAFAGIAHPHHFRKQLKGLGLNVIEFHPFADHHPYSPKDIEKLLDRAQKEHATLITTAKDAVRIPTKYKDKMVVAKQSLDLTQAHELRAMLTEMH